ncbi:serine-aspartate repeat-containing protein F-like [Bactrocera dorsalis]|uniref:Serine-aspartate repeat-containing protein F-like n=1 Tax=Bactrocera dorsalis TaxID=27457 RepID=A0A6J0RGN7_BACDO|nr:serine-aspartate repeat-containing protein F-like [Bactrocera dorsalis]
MRLTEIRLLVLLGFLQVIAKNEGRTIFKTPKISTEFTEETHKNDQANEGSIPAKEENIEKDNENQRLKSLIEELLLKGGNKVITEQLLNPNYYERKSDTEESKYDINQSNSTNGGNQIESMSTQTPELSTNVTPEGLKNITNFDNQKLPSTSSETSFNSTQNDTNHTTLNPLDTAERHAAISLHIFSTKEQNETGDHPIDHFSIGIKNVGNNETLKQQLDFLQKNAENIKKQQHIVGENDVNILERAECTNIYLSDTVDAVINNINSSYENLTANVATIYNQKVSQASLTIVSPELPMPLVQPTDTNEEPANSYALPILKDLTTIVGQQNESTNLGDESSYNDNLILSKSQDQPGVTNGSHQAEIRLSDDKISEQQEHGTHYVTQKQPLNYNNEVVIGTTSYETTKLRQPPAKPSKEKQSPTSDDKTSSGLLLNEDLSQSSELMDINGYSAPQKSAVGSLFEPSEPTISTSTLSHTFETANIEDTFKRLTEIFDEYSVPISSVLQQLSVGLEANPEIANLHTSTHEIENAQGTLVLAGNLERPDVIMPLLHDETDSMELGYGSDYSIFQSQMNLSNFIRTKEVASDEKSSNESLAHEVLDSDKDSVDEAPHSSQLNTPTTNYQSDEYGEGNESEHELNDTSATEYSNVNVVTTNPAATETKVSTTKMTLFDATTTPFATDPMATIANEPANNLEHLEVAIGNDVGKEIENIDKTNEMQVETIHQQQQQHQHFAADTALLAENTNDKSAWVANGLQHISNTLSAQPGKTTNPENAEEEHKGVPKPEVMCNKTEIIKSEQYSKTNENGNENETENEKADMISGGRVLLGRSLSYTISCHISKHEVPTTIVRVVHAANTTDEIDNNREKIIKNHEQLTITSADDSRNGLPVGTLKPLDAEPTAQRTETDSTDDKANEGAADVGVGSADTDGNRYYGVGSEDGDSAEEGMESGENYYIDGVEHEIDGDTDGAADVDGYVTGAASFHVNGIQSRVRQAAAMTAVAQLTTSLETDNDKTYEYDTRQPLQGGLSDKDVNFQSVEHVAASVVNSKITKQVDSSEGGADKDYQDNDGNDDNDDGDDDDDDNEGNASIEAVEFVTSDYQTENDSKYREAAHIGSVDLEPNSIAVTADADGTLDVDNVLQYKLAKAEADAVEAQENIENYNAELLKTETESTKLKNASGGVSDANSDDSEEDDNDDDGKGGGGDDADSDEDEEMADVSGTADDAEAEDSSAAATDPMIAAAAATKANGDDVKARRAMHRADTAS